MIRPPSPWAIMPSRPLGHQERAPAVHRVDGVPDLHGSSSRLVCGATAALLTHQLSRPNAEGRVDDAAAPSAALTSADGGRPAPSGAHVSPARRVPVRGDHLRACRRPSRADDRPAHPRAAPVTTATSPEKSYVTFMGLFPFGGCARPSRAGGDPRGDPLQPARLGLGRLDPSGRAGLRIRVGAARHSPGPPATSAQTTRSKPLDRAAGGRDLVADGRDVGWPAAGPGARSAEADRHHAVPAAARSTGGGRAARRQPTPGSAAAAPASGGTAPGPR